MLNLRLPGALLVVGALTVFGTGCQKLRARDNINKGVSRFRNAKYNDAVTLDRKSTRLNSSHIQKSRMPSSA